MTNIDEQVEGVELSQREIVGLLSVYDLIRVDVKASSEEQQRIGGLIRRYLEEHPGDEVRDGERRLEATLQYRSTGETYAVEQMDDALILALARHGCMTVDVKAVGALTGTLSAAAKAQEFKRRKGTTVALQVRAY